MRRLRPITRTFAALVAVLATLAPAAITATLAALAAPSPVRAARVSVDISACRAAGQLMFAMRAGAPRDSVRAALDSLMTTNAYRVMFRHYNRSWRPNHLPPDVFQRMILSLEFPDAYQPGENSRADAMLPRWRAAYNDLAAYQRKLARLESANLPELVERGVAYA